MLRLVLRSALAQSQKLRNPKPVIGPSSPLRLYGVSAATKSHPERIAAEMIRYALVDARTRPSADWREEAMRILEQGVSNLEEGGEGSGEAIAMLNLAISTLLYERGRLQDSMEKLEAVHQLSPSLAFRVASWEGMMSVRMEMGQEISSVAPGDSLEASTNGNQNNPSLIKLRANGVRGLSSLINGEIESAKSFFDGCQDCNAETAEDHIGNILFSYGVYLHCNGNFASAKDMYELAVSASNTKDIPREYFLAAANMVPEEVSLAGTCALGQLLSHTGKAAEAEEALTKALTKAEAHFGSTHPKVGVVLMCIAKMFKEKARLEGSSSILVQEGLYRRALDLLKAPDLNSEVNDMPVDKRDIVALARGGYAELLLIQQNRKEEGERMKRWAESVWRNRRLTLAEALDFSESSKLAVIDTRICRVI
ncbi:Tetratricopeptide repeat (TPR)-like superfamily protein [Rhynchospora pubera]|uniref:Tetratricopeptide repeat (TPR)-like superfamily protein n=1 Tax=Rhynchospora pubera TaxID=906938 RepID=A0AAV8DK58_9POAL|nr:Tetratricopeptide repeat (TPR)-like superfamily protein [Rhynchospora pubera]